MPKFRSNSRNPRHIREILRQGFGRNLLVLRQFRYTKGSRKTRGEAPCAPVIQRKL